MRRDGRMIRTPDKMFSGIPSLFSSNTTPVDFALDQLRFDEINTSHIFNVFDLID